MAGAKSGAQSVGSAGERAPRQASLRGFAKEIGVSPTAVRKAATSGRFAKSLGKDAKGAPFIADMALAIEEWNASSRTSIGVRTQVRTEACSASQGVHAAAAPPDAGGKPDEEGGGPLVFAKTLIDAQTLATNERARKLKMENDVADGRLVPIDQIKKEAFEAERIVRENMLNIAPRIAGALAAETDPQRVLRMLEAEMYQGLNAAADALSAVNE